MPTVQHRITGSTDDNLTKIAAIYSGQNPGLTWQQIADATFGGHSVAVIYDFLATHDGIKQTPYTGHWSGYHWSFAPNMVVNVPNVSYTLSAPLGTSVPAGDTVAVGNPESRTDNNYVATSEPPPSQPVDQSAPKVDVPTAPAKASIGGGFIPILIGGVAAYVVITSIGGNGKGKKKTSRSKRRRR